MIKLKEIVVGIVCVGLVSCAPKKTHLDIRSEIGQHLLIGETNRTEVVRLMRKEQFEVIDEANLRNVFLEMDCEYMPASYVEDRVFGTYITVIDFCFDPETKILRTYRLNDTTGGPMIFP